MPTMGRSARCAMPVLACISTRSKMATPVVSLPVPAVVGMAISGLSRPGAGSPRPTPGVPQRKELGRIGGVQVGGFGRVHARAAAHGDIAVECAICREADRLLEGCVGWFDSRLVEEHAVDVGGSQ